MKKNFLNLTLSVFVLLFTMTSCSKNETAEQAISEEEAVEIVERSFASNSAGLEMQIQETSKMTTDELDAQNNNDPCGVFVDSTITFTNQPGTIRTYEYNFAWNAELVCINNFIPQSINFNFNSDGQYDTPRMASNDNATYAFVITGLLPNADHYIYNGSSTRNGSQISKIGNQNEISSTLNYTTTNLKFNKAAQIIDEGEMEFTLSGNVVDGGNFSYEGTATFNGNGSVTITLNGNTFEIQI